MRLQSCQQVQSTLNPHSTGRHKVHSQSRPVSATELRRQLHWLPVRQRISKLAIITYKTNLTKTPAYLSDIIHEYHPTRTVRSADRLLLVVPRMPLTLSAKAFCVSAPSVWKSISYTHCRSADRTSQYFQATFKDRTV